MKTIAPASERFIMGISALLTRRWDVRFRFRISSQSASDVCSNLPRRLPPALATRISTPANSASVRRAKTSAAAGSVMSKATAATFVPCTASSASASFSWASPRAHTSRLQPSFARLWAMARPIPRLAPVMTAVFPCSPRSMILMICVGIRREYSDL